MATVTMKIFIVLLFLLLVPCVQAAYEIGPANNPDPPSNPTINVTPGNYKVSNDYFTIEFYRDTQGYDKLYYPNGSVAIYSERIVLDYWKTTGQGSWSQIGTPQQTGYYEQNGTIYLWRWYNDFIGTTYNITYAINNSNSVKFSMVMNDTTLSSRNYRVHWELDGIVNTNYVENGTEIIYDDIIINFKDVWDTWGDITTYDNTISAQGRKADFYFNVGIKNDFELDPSVEIGYAIEVEYNPTSSGANHQIIKDSSGNLYSTFPGFVSGRTINTTPYSTDVYVFKSTDFGETWNMIQNISYLDGSQVRNVEMWMNASGAMFITGYAPDLQKTPITFVSADNWSTYKNITELGVPIAKQLVTDTSSNNNTYACVVEDILYDMVNFYNWSGETNGWVNMSNIMIQNNGNMRCDFIIDHSGNFHIVVENQTGSLFYYNSSDGYSWTNTNISYDAKDYTYSVVMDVDSSNNIYIAFINGSYVGNAFSILNSSDGQSWTISPTIVAVADYLSMVIDDLDTIHVLNHKAGIFSNSIGYSYSADLGISWTTANYYIGGGVSDNDLFNPQFANTKYPTSNNASSVLRFLYFDDDANIVYFDTINVNYGLGNLTIPISTGNNKSDSNFTMVTNYTHENRAAALINGSWFKNGLNIYNDSVAVATSGSVVEFTLLNGNFSKGDNISLNVIGEDIYENFTLWYNSSNVTILNTAPVVSGVNVSVAGNASDLSPYDAENITCNYVYSDYDSDAESSVEYIWYNNSEVLAGNTTQNISSDYTVANDVWVCSVRVNDGTDWSDYLNSSNTTILADPGVIIVSGGGGGSTIKDLSRVLSNITAFCGDLICQEEETPFSCQSDCKINYDTLITCIWDEDIECNWEQTWFPTFLLIFLGIVGVFVIYTYEVNNQKKRR